MTYAANLAASDRTPQMIVELHMTRCDNHYTINGLPNQIAWSEDFSHWTALGTPSLIAGIDDPLGGFGASRITDNDGAAVEGLFISSLLAAASKTATYSFWIRAATPHDMTLSLNDNTDSEGTTATIKVSSIWTRYSVTRTFTGGASGNMKCYVRPTDLTAASVGTIDIWGAQLNEGAFPTSYQKTTGGAAQTSICTATDQGDGLRCCYSVPTCQDLPNFKTTQSGPDPGQRIFRFCLKDSPHPGFADVLPLLKEPVFSGQEIDPEQSTTIRERVTLTFFEDTQSGNFDADKLPGLTNTSTQGNFWRRFREIFRNYSERRIVIKEGFVGDVESEYQTTQDLLMKDFKINADGTATIDAVSKLSRVRRKIPANISDTNVLTVAFAHGVAYLDVTDATEFTDPSKLSVAARPYLEVGYDQVRELQGVAIFTEGSAVVTGKGTAFLTDAPFWELMWADSDDEVHAQQVSGVSSDTALTLRQPYTGRGGQAKAKCKASEFMRILNVDPSTNRVTVDTTKWTSVVPQTFAVGTKIREVIWYGTITNEGLANQNVTYEDAIDSAIRILRLCGIPEADIDVTALQAERDLAHSGLSVVPCRRLIREESSTDDLLQELQEVGQFNIFQDGTQITGKAYYPPSPSVALGVYDEVSSFLQDSQSVEDDDEDTRLTRVTAAFDQRGGFDGDKPGHFHRVLTEINLTSESPSGYGDRKEKTILSKNLDRSSTGTLSVIALVGRTLARHRDGMKRFPFSLELKDAGLKLGDFISVVTSRIQTVIGATATKTYQIVKKRRSSLSRWDFEALEAFGSHRIAIIGPNSMASDYDSRAAADIPYAYIGDASNRVGNLKEDGFYIF